MYETWKIDFYRVAGSCSAQTIPPQQPGRHQSPITNNTQTTTTNVSRLIFLEFVLRISGDSRYICATWIFWGLRSAMPFFFGNFNFKEDTSHSLPPTFGGASNPGTEHRLPQGTLSDPMLPHLAIPFTKLINHIRAPKTKPHTTSGRTTPHYHGVV